MGSNNGNTAIIRKRFYMQVLIKELGIDNKLNTSSTYEYLSNTNKEALILFHFNFILKKFQ